MEKEKSIEVFKTRFSDAIWFEEAKQRHILLLGVGGIGSWVMLGLCRAGFPLTIYDMDKVESHNLGGQLYSRAHVDKFKTEAMVELVREFAGFENKIETDAKYTEDSFSNTIVIAAFDNMASRKLAYEKWLDLLESVPEEGRKDFLFIDGRLIAEDYQIYAVTAKNARDYESTLFDDKAVSDAPCSFKATTHCSMGIASEIVSLITNFISNIISVREYGVEVREVPFAIVRSIPLYQYTIFNEKEPTIISDGAIPAVGEPELAQVG